MTYKFLAVVISADTAPSVGSSDLQVVGPRRWPARASLAEATRAREISRVNLAIAETEVAGIDMEDSGVTLMMLSDRELWDVYSCVAGMAPRYGQTLNDLMVTVRRVLPFVPIKTDEGDNLSYHQEKKMLDSMSDKSTGDGGGQKDGSFKGATSPLPVGVGN